MEYQAFANELSAKRRSVDDLIRYLKTRTDQNPNYTMLLGAGCSITSGIKSASELCNLWRKELYLRYAGEGADKDATVEAQRDYLQKNHGNWYDSNKEYSTLFEQRYDLQRQRRMFVETEVSGKTPSIGYAYLTSLVEQNYLNTLFTTNFDDLLNEAFYGYSDQRPIVCAHDSSINSVTITSKRPKIIKLHGDYLFDDLKSTNRETESLEQNMKSKFIEFAKDYGLIVVGYSGSDRSIVDVLSALLKNEDYFKGGIYWCVRKGSEISEDLRKLVWRERVYFVETEGFDELMADIFSDLNPGRNLPNGLWPASRRPTDLASKLLKNTHFNLSHKTLQTAKERLEKHTKKTALLDLIANQGPEDSNKPISGSGLTDDEFYVLAEIQNQINAENYRSAIENARKSLTRETKSNLKVRLLKLIIQAHEGLDENKLALNVVDELIQLYPKRSSNYLLRASLLRDEDEKFAAIEKACEVDPFSVDAHCEKAQSLMTSLKKVYGQERAQLVTRANEVVHLALELDPSWQNPCWAICFDLKNELNFGLPEKAKEEKQKLINGLKKQNLYSQALFHLRESILEEDSSEDEFNQFFVDISEAESRLSEDYRFWYAAPKLNALAKRPNLDDLNRQLQNYLGDTEFIRHEALTRAVAKILRSKFAKDAKAIDILQDSLEFEFDADVLTDLITNLCELKDHIRANNLLLKYGKRLSLPVKHIAEIEISDARGDYEHSLELLATHKAITGIGREQHAVFLNLKLQRWEQAESLARALLFKCNYSIEAREVIVNLELACKMQNKNISTKRLEDIIKSCNSSDVLAAVYALLDKKKESLSFIKKTILSDRTFRISAKDWPVFQSYHTDAEFLKLVNLEFVP